MSKAIELLKGAINKFLDLAPSVSLHMENRENPHAVTKSQVGLGNVKNEEQATKAEFHSHKENRENPHGVTKEQVGLSAVINEKQATAKELCEHVAGISEKHRGSDIMYSDTKSVKEKIDELIIEGGSGTMCHDELLNRDLPSQHPIDAIDGLSEKLGEVLVFEGITTGAQETALTSKTKSIFIDSDGYLLLPAGYAANFEAIIIGVREQNGIISDRNAVSYEMNGFIFKMNSAQTLCTDNTIIREKLTGSDGAVAYTCSLTGYPSKYFSVKGADGHRVFWKATLRLKNIVKVEGEA